MKYKPPYTCTGVLSNVEKSRILKKMLDQNGYFMAKSNRINDEVSWYNFDEDQKIAFLLDFFNRRVICYKNTEYFDKCVVFFEIPLTKTPFYDGQRPIRCNYIGANSSDDEFFYFEDKEGRAEHEKRVIMASLDLEKESEKALKRETTGKRKM